MPDWRPRLVIMLKEPRAGRVKTRLARDIGPVAATWWFRHQVRRLLRRISDPRWDTVLAVSPDRAASIGRTWPVHFERQPQGRGNLGDRMARMMRQQGNGPVAIIGGDIPGLTKAHIGRAFRVLGRSDFALGPAPDGGYWLIGWSGKRPLPAGLFRDVRWSSPYAMADTIRSISGSSYAVLDELQDVDTAADLGKLSQ